MVEQWREHSLKMSSKPAGGDLGEDTSSVLTKRFARLFTAAMFTRYGWALRTFLNLDTDVIIQLEGPSTLSNRVMPIY